MEYVLHQRRYQVPDSYVYEQIKNCGLSTKEACEKYVNTQALNMRPQGTSKSDVLAMLKWEVEHLYGPATDIGRSGFSFTAGDNLYEVRIVKKQC